MHALICVYTIETVVAARHAPCSASGRARPRTRQVGSSSRPAENKPIAGLWSSDTRHQKQKSKSQPSPTNRGASRLMTHGLVSRPQGHVVRCKCFEHTGRARGITEIELCDGGRAAAVEQHTLVRQCLRGTERRVFEKSARKQTSTHSHHATKKPKGPKERSSDAFCILCREVLRTLGGACMPGWPSIFGCAHPRSAKHERVGSVATCMYVCMYGCMYACMYVCMYVCL